MTTGNVRLDREGPLLTVANLAVSYRTRRSWHKAVDQVSFTIGRGQTLCLVGESGSGKSSIAMAIPRLLPSNARISGTIQLAPHKPLNELAHSQLREVRRREISFVFQDARGALVPGVRLGRQIERVVAHRRGTTTSEARVIGKELLGKVGLVDVDRFWGGYARELSGGECQRLCIALALSINPSLVIADEPLSAVDAITQVKILQLLLKLQKELGFAMLFVTHDLRLATHFDRVAVLRGGRIVEVQSSHTFLTSPEAAYSRELLESAQQLSLSLA